MRPLLKIKCSPIRTTCTLEPLHRHCPPKWPSCVSSKSKVQNSQCACVCLYTMWDEIWFYPRCSSIYALYYKYVNMIICTHAYITSIVFMSENSLLANVYFTLYPTLNKILLTYTSYQLCFLLTNRGPNCYSFRPSATKLWDLANFTIFIFWYMYDFYWQTEVLIKPRQLCSKFGPNDKR